MTLAFSEKINKKPTYFVQKINFGLWENDLITKEQYIVFVENHYIGKNCPVVVPPKIHTIRADDSNRWKAGNDIHFVINNRTKNRYQFAPVVKCLSTQRFSIKYYTNPKTQKWDNPLIMIDDHVLTKPQIHALAINDGFSSVADFLKFFDKDFTGKIIHWTNLKY